MRDDLRRLLLELELPVVRVRGGGEFVYLSAWRVIALTKRRFDLDEDAERATDAAVAGIGGQRLSVMDPWRLLPDLLRRLRGKPLSPSGDLYALPVDILYSAREEPRR